MQTDDLRALVKAAAVGTPGAKLWPNGLGFDCQGTSYRYSERLACWEAYRAIGRAAMTFGEGPTPQAAKLAAGIGGRSVNSRGGRA